MGNDEKSPNFGNGQYGYRFVVPNLRLPATGFGYRLDTFESLRDETAQELETALFSPVDGRAVTVHLELCEGRVDGLIESGRIGRVMFINSMLMRAPKTWPS